jgi:hypothetical protein
LLRTLKGEGSPGRRDGFYPYEARIKGEAFTDKSVKVKEIFPPTSEK